MASRSVTMANKVLRQKLKCSVRLSDKSRFLKQEIIKGVVKVDLNYYKTSWLIVSTVMMKKNYVFGLWLYDVNFLQKLIHISSKLWNMLIYCLKCKKRIQKV